MARKYKVGDTIITHKNYGAKTDVITYVEPEDYKGIMVYKTKNNGWWSENYITLSERPKVTKVYNQPVTICWALQEKTTGELDKELLFPSRKEAREWIHNWTPGGVDAGFKPVKVEVRVVASR